MNTLLCSLYCQRKGCTKRAKMSDGTLSLCGIHKPRTYSGNKSHLINPWPKKRQTLGRTTKGRGWAQKEIYK